MRADPDAVKARLGSQIDHLLQLLGVVDGHELTAAFDGGLLCLQPAHIRADRFIGMRQCRGIHRGLHFLLLCLNFGLLLFGQRLLLGKFLLPGLLLGQLLLAADLLLGEDGGDRRILGRLRRRRHHRDAGRNPSAVSVGEGVDQDVGNHRGNHQHSQQHQDHQQRPALLFALFGFLSAASGFFLFHGDRSEFRFFFFGQNRDPLFSFRFIHTNLLLFVQFRRITRIRLIQSEYVRQADFILLAVVFLFGPGQPGLREQFVFGLFALRRIPPDRFRGRIRIPVVLFRLCQIRFLVSFDNLQHHLLQIAELLFVLPEDRLRAGFRLQQTVVLAVVQHHRQFLRRPVTLILLEAQGFFDDVPEMGAGCRGRVYGFPAHTHQLGVAALALKGKLALTGAVIEQKAEGVDVRLRAGLVVPVDLRSDIFEFLLPPVAFPGRADPDLPVGVAADILRIDSAVIGLAARLRLDLTADLRHKRTEVLSAQFHQVFAQGIFRFKNGTFDLPSPLFLIQCIVSHPAFLRQECNREFISYFSIFAISFRIASV